MTEWHIDLTCAIHAKDDDERDEIIKRLVRALSETEWKVTDAECVNVERA